MKFSPAFRVSVSLLIPSRHALLGKKKKKKEIQEKRANFQFESDNSALQKQPERAFVSGAHR